MSEKYEDLASRISDDLEPTMAGEAYIRNSLRWLDRNPDQVPGRTITENELEASVVHARQCASFTTNPVGFVRSALDILGFTVVPDPEPTNAELINEAYDAWDRDPQSFKQSFTFGEYLDRLGWVKAPGGDDDR